jgi:hypothetical protein
MKEMIRNEVKAKKKEKRDGVKKEEERAREKS